MTAVFTHLQSIYNILTTVFHWAVLLALEANIDSNNKKRILILEDDNDTLYLFGDALRVYGFEVDMFSDPDYALNSFLSTPSNYDLLLMDLSWGKRREDTLQFIHQ